MGFSFFFFFFSFFFFFFFFFFVVFFSFSSLPSCPFFLSVFLTSLIPLSTSFFLSFVHLFAFLHPLSCFFSLLCPSFISSFFVSFLLFFCKLRYFYSFLYSFPILFCSVFFCTLSREPKFIFSSGFLALL